MKNSPTQCKKWEPFFSEDYFMFVHGPPKKLEVDVSTVKFDFDFAYFAITFIKTITIKDYFKTLIGFSTKYCG